MKFGSVGKTGAVAVGAAAPTALTVDIDVYRGAIHLYNLGPDTVYYGFDDGVTASNGIPLPINKDVYYDGTVKLWGICAGTGTADVRVAVLG